MAEACQWCRFWKAPGGPDVRLPSLIGKCELDPRPPNPPEGWPATTGAQLCDMFEWDPKYRPDGFQRQVQS
jgi:hypothetical protein